MLPIRDRNPSSVKPYVTYTLIGVNVLIFLLELSLPSETLRQVIMALGMVPERVTAVLQGEGKLLLHLIIPAFTSMFLHGGWIHLIGNMWYLFIFGDNVEGRLGRSQFLGFYLACGLCAQIAQYALSPGGQVPVIGASGAIAGVLGAYLICWPAARIITLLPIFFFITFVELPALVVLGFWFIIQFFQGAASLGTTFASGGVAYWAHVGGFAAGAALIKLLSADKKKRKDKRRPPDRRQRGWQDRQSDFTDYFR